MTDFAKFGIEADTSDLDRAGRRLNELGDQGDRSEKRISSATGRMNAGFTKLAGVVGVATAAISAIGVKGSLGFEKSIAEVSTLINGLDSEVTKLEATSRRLSTQFGTGAQDQAAGFYQAISAGAKDAAEATEILTTANKLAIGGVTTVQNSVDILTTVLNTYGDEAGNAGDVSDTLFTAMKAGKTTITELSTSLGKVVPLSQQLGVSFEETAGTVAALTKGGIATTEAVTGLRAVLASIVKPSSEAVKAAKELGIAFNAQVFKDRNLSEFLQEIQEKTGGSAEKLGQLFTGVESLIPILALSGNIGDEFNTIMEQMDEKVGNTDVAFQLMTENNQFKVDQFFSSVNNIALSLGGTLADILTPAIEGVSKALNGLNVEDFQVGSIEQQKEVIVGIREEIEHLTGLKGVFGIFGPNKAEFDILEDKLQNAISDLNKLERAAEKTALANRKVFSTNFQPESTSDNDPVDKVIKSTRKAISEGDRFIASLRKQASEVGLTGVALLKARAAILGKTDAAKADIEIIEKQLAISKEQRDIARAAAEDERKIQQITASVATDQEKLNAELQEFARLRDLPGDAALGMEDYQRAVKQATDEFDKLQDNAKDVFGNIDQFVIQSARNLQTTIAEGFTRVFKGEFDGLVDLAKNTVTRILAEFAALKTAQSLGLGTLLGGASGSALASSGSLTSGISSLFSAGSSLFTNFSNGVTGALASGITSLGNTFGSTALTSFASGLNGSATAGVFGAGGIPFLGGAGTAVGTQGISAAGLGAGFGSAVPIIGGALIADQLLKPLFGDKQLSGVAGKVFDNIPVIGTLINGLFGRGPLKQKESNLIGDVNSEGFNGATIVKFKASGGAFRGSKTDRVINDTDSGELLNSFAGFEESGIAKELQPFADDAAKFSIEIGNLLDNTIQGMSRSIGGFVENLGGSADVVDTFATSINIATEKGEALSESDISDALDVVADDFARHALPIVDEFIRQGESAFDTLQRLSDEVVVLTQLGNALGHASDQVKSFLDGVDTEVRSRFVDDAGGVQALNSQVSFFSQNFLDPQEQIAESRSKVEEELGKLGLSLDTTKDQFKELVQSFGQFNGIGQETLLSLLKIAPAFLAVKEVLSDATGAALDFADAQKNITQLRSNLVSSYNRERSELQAVISEFDNLSNTLLSFKDRLRIGELSPLTPGQKLDEARQQFNSTRRLAEGGDADAIAKLPEIAQSFLQASQTFNASGGTFSSDFNFVQSVLDSVGATAQSEADLARLQLTELESTVSVLTEIDAGVTTIDQSIQDLTAAVLTGLGNPDISNKQINDWLAANPDATPQDIVNTAVGADISADQFIGATGANPANVSVVTGGLSITDDQIREFVSATPDPFAIHQKALEFGISSERLSNAIGLPHDEILKFVKDNKLAEFQAGTDFVPNTGLALVHKGEAVTPSTVPAEIKLLREEIKQLREDQNRQTDALINVTREASQSNAKAIVSSNKETSQLNQWADRSAVRAG